MCARRRCESQYRKMLYFCYEIYYAYLYSSRNYVYFFVVVECLYLIHWRKNDKMWTGVERLDMMSCLVL